MSNTIIELRHSYVTGNVPSSLANGEIAINTYDGKLFYRGGVSNTIQTIERFQGPAGLNQEVQFNDSGVLGSDSGLTYNKTTDALTVAGQLLGSTLKSTQSSGDEGGQLDLATAATNQSLVGGFVNIDIFQNRLRIFEAGGTNRGVYIDMANGATAGVGTDLLSPSTSTDGWARGQANAAFAKANTQDAINLTQNNSITAAFAAANAATATDTTQNNSITAAFTRANNSLDANNGGTVTGTITATSFITTGSYGNILGANTIYANNFIANTGFIQFADGSKQYTANAGSGGGGGSSNSFATISNTATALVANTSNTRLTIVGESGIVVAMNSSINQITIAAQPGAQGLTVDYGFVAEPVYYALDYGTLS